MTEDHKELVNTIKRLPNYTKIMYHLYREPNLQRKQKVLLTTALGYLISPVELVPGVIPVIGQLDDVIIVLSILRKVLKSMEEEMAKNLLMEHGLSFDILEQDILLSKKTGVRIIKGVSRFLGKTLVFTGKSIFRLGTYLIKK